jgi:hypothetical protein
MLLTEQNSLQSSYAIEGIRHKRTLQLAPTTRDSGSNRGVRRRMTPVLERQVVMSGLGALALAGAARAASAVLI